jgi:hypothetical protein
MEIPTPQGAVAALATFVRHRLAEVSETLAPLIARGETAPRSPRQVATAIVAAAAPFATTSYARARLLRQLHASGLLSERETEQTIDLLRSVS